MSKPSKSRGSSANGKAIKAHTDALIAHTAALKENTANIGMLTAMLSDDTLGCCRIIFDGTGDDEKHPNMTRYDCIKKANELNASHKWTAGPCK